MSCYSVARVFRLCVGRGRVHREPTLQLHAAGADARARAVHEHAVGRVSDGDKLCNDGALGRDARARRCGNCAARPAGARQTPNSVVCVAHLIVAATRPGIAVLDRVSTTRVPWHAEALAVGRRGLSGLCQFLGLVPALVWPRWRLPLAACLSLTRRAAVGAGPRRRRAFAIFHKAPCVGAVGRRGWRAACAARGLLERACSVAGSWHVHFPARCSARDQRGAQPCRA